MRIPANAVEGIFVRRVNRFRAEVRAGRKNLAVHVAHSGRLGELLVPGNRVLLIPAAGAERKTSHDLLLAGRPDGRGWVCVDARVPNKLMKEALEAGRLPGFEGFSRISPEPRVPGGRLDFCLTGEGVRPCWIETKCVTLVEEGVARFPDAPTIRGARHLRHLIGRARAGGRSAVLFIIARPDARSFSPNEKNDPLFAETLREAVSAGVTARALKCDVNKKRIQILDEIPMRIAPPPP